ncbi:MAG: YncE family protein, partial [Gemmatimonadetes bacterium]|nr:YncE family protein [Gemmatimonadota bacterium]
MRLTSLAVGALLAAGLACGGGRQAAADRDLLLVTNKSGNTVSFIDPATGEELARLDTGPNPHEVAVTPDG